MLRQATQNLITALYPRLARICETLNCEITDVIELVPDEPASTGGKEHERIETKNNGKRN